MTKISPATADHWAVSTRTNGAVLTAAVSMPGVELCLLGIPTGFTAAEIQSWLRDLAGVAIETSRNDARTRPIPQLLHHALTGLLFSQTELWSHTGQSMPCAAVFVSGPQGVAFGWVGGARVLLLVNGEPYDPQWVIVRDEAGHEAMSAMLPTDVHALLTLDYWPRGNDGHQSPAAVDAEWGHAARDDATGAEAELPAAAVTPLAPEPASATAPATALAPAPEALPTQQPGLAPDPSRVTAEFATARPAGATPGPERATAAGKRALDVPDAEQALPSTHHPSAATFAMPSLPGSAGDTAAGPANAPSSAAHSTEEGTPALIITPNVTAELVATVSTPAPDSSPPVLPAAFGTGEGSPPVLAEGAAETPPAVWSPASSGAFLPEPSSADAGEPAPLPLTLREQREQSERLAGAEHDPKHPVGRWLSRLMGFGRKPQPAPSALPPVSSYDAILHHPAAGEAMHAGEAAPVQESLPLVPADIEEPHALPAMAATPPAQVPTPMLPQRGGLTAAGLNEILGVKGTGVAKAGPPAAAPGAGTSHPLAAPQRAAASGDAPRMPGFEPGLPTSLPVPTGHERPVEGLIAVSAASGPLEVPPSTLITPDSQSSGTPPYPMLEVTAARPDPRSPIQIDREPVGADVSFAIPKLPAMEAPKPVKVALPSAAPQQPPPAPAQAPPIPPSAATPPPVLRSPGVPVAKTTVPEPPAAFLAEFEASMRVVPASEPAPARPTPSAATRETGPPALRIPKLPAPSGPAAVSAPPVRPAPVAPPAAAPPVGPPAAAVSPVVAAPVSAPAPVVAPSLPAPVPAASAAPLAPPPVAVPVAPAAPPTPVLRTPTAAEPVPVVAAAQAELMRELPLPTPSAEMARPPLAADDEGGVPEGMLVATQATPMPAGSRPRLAAWPSAEELTPGRTPVWKKPWAIAAFVTVLFGVGWIVGHSQAPDNDVHATPLSRVLRMVGLGGARFTASIDTDPPGAWIAIDGKEISRRTPSTIELPPGEHTVTLSMPDLGSIQVPLTGTRGQKQQVNETLHGSLDVRALDPALPVKMSLDGKPQGWLPVNVAKLPPGMHEVQFSGPNMQTWGQTVNILIRKNTELVTRPMTSPATGVVQVQASNNDDNGTAPLSGASVFVDGELRGVTPLTLELPRGPHSLRVTYRDETAPVQVIDLPGGNKRFAAFQFGLDSDLPPLRLQGSYAMVTPRKVTTVSATLDGLDVKDVREAWLHARSPEGLWRRYEMNVANGPRGAVLSAVFPGGMLEGQTRVLWYLSAATAQGDDFYTEMQRSSR